MDQLNQQIQFVLELDKLKGVLRQTLITDGSRQENSAEHSWHLAMMAIALADHAQQPIQVDRVIKMVLLHDVVEIDAGDTFCYDTEANLDKAEREQQAANRLFGLLPQDQAEMLHAYWQEFEAQETADAQFAAALDRLQPFLHNIHTQGHTWKQHGISKAQVLKRMQPVKTFTPALWPVVEDGIQVAIAQGWITS